MFLIVKHISRPGKNCLIKVSWATWIYSTCVSTGEKLCDSGNRVMQALGTKLFVFFDCRMSQGQAVLNSNGIKKEMRTVNTTLHVTYK